jgi:hypothetical protein
MCGRDLELQQDPQRHVLIPWRRALVDWKPGTSRAGSPLVIAQLLTSQPPDTVANPQMIDTEGGSVTLLELGALRARVQALESERDKAASDAMSLRALAEGLWVQVGSTLITKPDQWSPSPQGADLLQQAVSLSGKVAADDSELDSIRAAEHGGIGGLAGKLGTWSERRKLSSERTNLESQLQPLLSQVARQNPQANLPEIDSIREQAVNADAQAQELEQHAASLSTAVPLSKEELERRSDAELAMGFDAPYLGAYLKTHGPPVVQSPLILKRGEQASAVVTATFARRQTRRQWVGGSQGFSFPIGHTGIRYRVGSFHGHPIEQQSLTNLDTGKLVITNQRIAFIGQGKSTSIPFAKLLHVECYSDAVAVFLEGRENPVFYLMSQPKYALFMINWFLNQVQ